MEIEEKLVSCGFTKPDSNKELDDPGKRMVDLMMMMGFEQGMRFSKENPEYAIALLKGLQSSPGRAKVLLWEEQATIEFRQVMEQHPITSSMSEDEFARTVEANDNVGYVVNAEEEVT